mmetsp:Transcript_50645/g.109364  ORF Transcript_50645/g.109364 Transcript_50645/m.109364 type:complete len:272 (+) Transcript_50645:1191-2006(+)
MSSVREAGMIHHKIGHKSGKSHPKQRVRLPLRGRRVASCVDAGGDRVGGAAIEDVAGHKGVVVSDLAPVVFGYQGLHRRPSPLERFEEGGCRGAFAGGAGEVAGLRRDRGGPVRRTETVVRVRSLSAHWCGGPSLTAGPKHSRCRALSAAGSKQRSGLFSSLEVSSFQCEGDAPKELAMWSLRRWRTGSEGPRLIPRVQAHGDATAAARANRAEIEIRNDGVGLAHALGPPHHLAVDAKEERHGGPAKVHEGVRQEGNVDGGQAKRPHEPR